MKAKTKDVIVGEQRFVIRRMSPNVGSFILSKLIAATISDSVGAPEPQKETPAPEPAEKIDGEQLVRVVSFGAFKGLDFKNHEFIQRACLSVCSKIEMLGDVETPMPIINDSGVWAFPDIRDDVAMVMALQMEALVFNFTDFFEQGSLKALAGQQAST